jgi:hypothetical protein
MNIIKFENGYYITDTGEKLTKEQRKQRIIIPTSKDTAIINNMVIDERENSKRHKKSR